MIKFEVEDKTYNMIDLGFKYVTEISEPTITETKPKTLFIPGRIGVVDFGEDIEESKVYYTFLANFKERHLFIDALNKLKQILLDEYGFPKYVKIIRDYDPLRYFWAKVRVASIPRISDSLKSFTLEFRLSDPFSYSTHEVNDVRWGSTSIDFRADYKLGHEGSGAVDLPVKGSTSFLPTLDGYAVQPYIILQGSSSSFAIRTGTSYITHNGFSGRLEIDTENYIAYLNGKELFLQRFDEFYLVPNEKVHLTGTNMDFKITVHYRWKYI